MDSSPPSDDVGGAIKLARFVPVRAWTLEAAFSRFPRELLREASLEPLSLASSSKSSDEYSESSASLECDTAELALTTDVVAVNPSFPPYTVAPNLGDVSTVFGSSTTDLIFGPDAPELPAFRSC